MCMLLSSLNTVSDLTLSNITDDQGYLKDSKVYSPMLLYIWVSKLHMQEKGFRKQYTHFSPCNESLIFVISSS